MFPTSSTQNIGFHRVGKIDSGLLQEKSNRV